MNNRLRSITTQMAPNIMVKIVFVKNKSKNNEWLTILVDYKID